jgi:hypothetical protein
MIAIRSLRMGNADTSSHEDRAWLIFDPFQIEIKRSRLSTLRTKNHSKINQKSFWVFDCVNIGDQKVRSMVRNSTNLKRVWDLPRLTSRQYLSVFLTYFDFSKLFHISSYLLLLKIISAYACADAWTCACACACACARVLKILMKKRAVVRFFTLKGLNPRDFHA